MRALLWFKFRALILVSIYLNINSLNILMAEDIQAPKPIAYWNFDEIKDNTVWDTNGAFKGTLCGETSVPEKIKGISGNALRFRSKEKHSIMVKDTKQLSSAGHITITAWVRLDASFKNRADIIGFMPEQRKRFPGPLYGFRLSIGWKCSTIDFYIGDGSVNEFKCSAAGSSSFRGSWMHLAVTFDGENVKIYINGVEKKKTNFSNKIAYLKKMPAMRIGAYVNGNAYFFSGDIDEIRIYDTALTEDQILKGASEALPPCKKLQ